MKSDIRWKEEFRLGNEAIDNQHKVLFDLANDLSNAVRLGSSKQVVDTLFAVIMDYAFKHFALEEKDLQAKEGYLEHCYEHYQLLRQLQEYSVEFRNDRKMAQAPGEFLNEWLSKHIRTCDVPSLQGDELVPSTARVIDEVDDFDSGKLEKRQHRRVRYDSILDEVIYAHCYNTTAMRTQTVTIVDLSGGGLKIGAQTPLDVGDLLIISCRVGRNFKMKEKARVRNAANNFYGVEFIMPEKETVRFLTELSGAVQKFR